MIPTLTRALPLAAAGLIVVATVMSACAAQPGTAPGPAQAPSTAPTKIEPAAASGKPAAAPEKPAPAPVKTTGPQVGGTLVYAVPSAAYDGLDPQGPRVNGDLLTYLGSGLVARDLTTGQTSPSLAENWKVSGDGLTYEFKIRKDAKFHDGTPLTAKDYVYSFQRHTDPATKSTTANRVWGSVASAEAADDYTFVVRMKSPDITFLSGLAVSPIYTQPVPKHAIEALGNKFATQTVLSGPFKFKESQVGVKIVAERNPLFAWGAPPNPGPPYIQTLEFREVKDYATILAGLESGEIDLAAIRANDVDRLKATGKIKVETIRVPGLSPTLAINTSKAPWDDVRVRKAVNLALDRQALVKVLSNGLFQEMRGPVPKGSFGYWQGVEKTGYSFDLSQAKALMKDAGYAMGSGGILEKDGKALRFTLKANAEAPFDQLAVLIKEQLKALGIELDIQMGPRPDITAEVVAGKFDLASASVTGQPDGILLLNEVFHSSSPLNFNRVKDPKLDELVVAARRSTDEKKALEIAAEAQKLAIENAYSVPVFSNVLVYAINNRVKGVIANEHTLIWTNLTGAYLEGGR